MMYFGSFEIVQLGATINGCMHQFFFVDQQGNEDERLTFGKEFKVTSTNHNNEKKLFQLIFLLDWVGSIGTDRQDERRFQCYHLWSSGSWNCRFSRSLFVSLLFASILRFQ